MSNVLYVNNLEKQIAENEKRYDKFDRMHKEASRQLVEERDELRQQLAAEQAYSAKLHAELLHVKSVCLSEFGNGLVNEVVLAIPHDDTVLREWGASLLEKVIYRGSMLEEDARQLRSGEWKP